MEPTLDRNLHDNTVTKLRASNGAKLGTLALISLHSMAVTCADCRLTIAATSADDFTAIGLVVEGGESVDLMPTMPGVVVEAIVTKRVTKTQ